MAVARRPAWRSSTDRTTTAYDGGGDGDEHEGGDEGEDHAQSVRRGLTVIGMRARHRPLDDDEYPTTGIHDGTFPRAPG